MSSAIILLRTQQSLATIAGLSAESTPPATINDDGATYKVGIQNSLGGVTSNVVTLSVSP